MDWDLLFVVIYCLFVLGMLIYIILIKPILIRLKKEKILKKQALEDKKLLY